MAIRSVDFEPRAKEVATKNAALGAREVVTGKKSGKALRRDVER